MQTTDTVLMIEPVNFGYNAETAENNYFQIEQEGDNIHEKALAEFQNFVQKLRDNGITVISVKDTLDPYSPDSIFPNNWVSFHSDGTVITYPMFAENRRVERRPQILEQVKKAGFVINSTTDYSKYENEGIFLEGTGSIIFDYDSKLAYGSVSLRLDENLFREFCENMGYESVVFHSFQTANGERLPIYHTNVMMCVADQFVVICLDCIDDLKEREMVKNTILRSKKELIEITEEQLENFAGNMLQVNNAEGEKFLIMSLSAHRSLREDQINSIQKYCRILSSDLETIETNGGGSARCMLAEVFLPKA